MIQNSGAPVFPFSAILGQETLKLALLLNAINPRVGGVLVRGEKGTAKSTSVRALASLLPEIEVFKDCPFNCGPGEEDYCDRCQGCAPPRPSVKRKVRVVTLPLNATEDRVIGGLDFERAIRTGKRILQPGLLARAHRGILYVDEVNLLDDHLVDVILDAAASGDNLIEREGVSLIHPADFVLVGTMNPEEGELRPQFLDRFGLCVEVTAVKDREERAVMMIRREAFDGDPIGFSREFEPDSQALAGQVLEGRLRLGQVRLPGTMRPFIGEVCLEAHVAGHRADLVIEQGTRALASFEGRVEVTAEDVARLAPLALAHRRRDAAPPPPPPPPEHDHQHEPPDQPPNDDQKPDDQEQTEENQEENPEDRPQEKPSENRDQEQTEPPEDREQDPPEDPDEPAKAPPAEVLERIFEVGDTFKVKRLTAPKDRVFRRGSGRRSRTRASGKQGRYVKSTLPRGSKDIALDATIRAAAPFQNQRHDGRGLALVLRPEDIREKIRERRVGNFLVFLVDASGSMGARGRMTATKGAIMSLLLDAYQKRDKVAMISFNKLEARVNLPPTSSIDTAARLLSEMPVGGRTPLSAGLVKTADILRAQLVRDPTSRPLVLLLTDGRSNVALGQEKPVKESLALAQKISQDQRIRFIVVDTEDQGLMRFGLAAGLAEALNASYFKTDDLKADTLVDLVKGDARS